MNNKTREDFRYSWEERDDFIKWVAVFSVGGMYFCLNTILNSRTSSQSYYSSLILLCFEWAVIFLFLSLCFSVIYKCNWAVKYIFDRLDISVLKYLWNRKAEILKLEEKHKKGSDISEAEIQKFRISIEADFVLASGRSKVLKKIEGDIKKDVNFVDFLYKTALGCFVFGFFLIILAMAFFFHPEIYKIALNFLR